MRRPRIATPLLLLVSCCVSFYLSGCGSTQVGIGFDIDGRPLGHAAPSPFAGRWSGAWSEVEGEQAGTIELSISAAGAVTVVVQDGSTGAIARGVGKVAPGGQFSGTYRFSGGPRLTLQGTLAIEAGTQLRGLVERFEGTRSVGAVTLGLVRQA